MANYTTKLKTICEYYAGQKVDQHANTIKEVIEIARPLIFDFDYPIWDNQYKEILETKILRHYLNYEIGQETPALWKFDLETALNEYMPYINELYKTTILEYNPLYNIDYTETYTGTKEGNENNTSKTTGTDTTTGTAQRTDNLTEGYTREYVGKDIIDNNRNLVTIDRTETLDEYTNHQEETGTTSETTTSTKESVGHEDNVINGSESQKVTDKQATNNVETTQTSSTNNNYSTERFSDTPQGGLDGMYTNTSGQGVSGNLWLTNATIKESNDNGSTTGRKEDTGMLEDTKTTTGSNASNETKDNSIQETVNGETSGKSTTNNSDNGHSKNNVNESIDTTINDRNILDHTQDITDSKTNTGTQTNTKNDTFTTTRNGEGQKTFDNTTDYVKRVIGKNNSFTYSKVINDLRDSLINIDMMVIHYLSDLFINLW